VPDDPTSRFAELVARTGDDLPLDESCLLVAAHALPALDLEAECKRLDELAAGLPVPTLDALRRHLVVSLGFAGDQEAYHDPRNSLLPQVIDRRLGIPLSLAIVAIEVGRRGGVPLHGIGMPGHFLLRAVDDEDRFLDLFNGGIELDRAGCRAVFDRLHPSTPWADRYLDPVGPVAMVARMLGNLSGAYRRNGDRAGLIWSLELRRLLPDVSERERRELAVLLGAVGRYDEAAELLEATGDERDARAALRMRARLN
jgi:regulator of sirC expression with transglutaminase-like and TPR domain